MLLRGQEGQDSQVSFGFGNLESLVTLVGVMLGEGGSQAATGKGQVGVRSAKGTESPLQPQFLAVEEVRGVRALGSIRLRTEK